MREQRHVCFEAPVTLPSGEQATAWITCAPILDSDTWEALCRMAQAVAEALGREDEG
jgi:hypothetical protein